MAEPQGGIAGNGAHDVDDRARARYGEPMAQLPLTLRRWKRVEYERLVDLGVFQGDPPPDAHRAQSSAHAYLHSRIATLQPGVV